VTTVDNSGGEMEFVLGCHFTPARARARL